MEIKRKGSLLSFRPDIKVLDATLRDGGLCNNFAFSDDFAKALYKMNIAAGVDYMEMGYKASKAMFDPAKFGKYKFCDEADLQKIVGDHKSGMKLSVMADVGRTDFKKDIGDKKNSVVDMVRVACYITEIPAAIEMLEYCAKKGYETAVNVMAVSKARDEEIDAALEMLGQSPADCIYLVDSYGSLYPEQVAKLTLKYLEAGENTKSASAFTRTTTSSSPSAIPSKRQAGARACSTPPSTAWAAVRATVRWSFCSGF